MLVPHPEGCMCCTDCVQQTTIQKLRKTLQLVLDDLELADSRAHRPCAICNGVIKHEDGCGVTLARRLLNREWA